MSLPMLPIKNEQSVNARSVRNQDAYVGFVKMIQAAEAEALQKQQETDSRISGNETPQAA